MIMYERKRRKSYVSKPKITYGNVDYKPGEYPETQYTEAEQALITELSKQKIDYMAQIPFIRKDEKTKGGQSKQYIADIIIKNVNIILEVEGSKSASSDNPNRDRYFQEKGFQMIHIPNEVALEYSYLLADLIKAFLSHCKKT